MSAQGRRRRHAQSDGGGEGGGMMRWLLTYADMITLLLVFFIVLYALSVVNQDRYKSLMEALRAALTGQQVSTVGKTHETHAKFPPPSPIPSSNEDFLLKKLQAVIQKDHLSAKIQVYPVPQGVMVMILSGVLFNPGQARIQTSAVKVMGDLGKVLAAVPNPVVVQGFTDSTPIDTPTYHSNWDLSAMRAARVVDYWTTEGLSPARFMIEGYGQYAAVATNQTAAGRARNRRVDVLVLKKGEIDARSTLVVGTE